MTTNTCGDYILEPLTYFPFLYSKVSERSGVFQPSSLGNEGESKTGVAAEPELKRNIEGSSLSTVKSSTSKGEGVANHIVVSNLVSGLLSKLVPDVEPITVLLINTLASDLDLNVADNNVADIVHPTEAKVSLSRSGLRALNERKSNLKVSAVNKITVTRNSASYTLSEISSAVKDLLNRLHREVSVTTINHLEESDLGVSG